MLLFIRYTIWDGIIVLAWQNVVGQICPTFPAQQSFMVVHKNICSTILCVWSCVIVITTLASQVNTRDVPKSDQQ